MFTFKVANNLTLTAETAAVICTIKPLKTGPLEAGYYCRLIADGGQQTSTELEMLCTRIVQKRDDGAIADVVCYWTVNDKCNTISAMYLTT
jgi:hypothetical protein